MLCIWVGKGVPSNSYMRVLYSIQSHTYLPHYKFRVEEAHGPTKNRPRIFPHNVLLTYFRARSEFYLKITSVHWFTASGNGNSEVSAVRNHKNCRTYVRFWYNDHGPIQVVHRLRRHFVENFISENLLRVQPLLNHKKCLWKVNGTSASTGMSAFRLRFLLTWKRSSDSAVCKSFGIAVGVLL